LFVCAKDLLIEAMAVFDMAPPQAEGSLLYQ
jgi:hypothetical protein